MEGKISKILNFNFYLLLIFVSTAVLTAGSVLLTSCGDNLYTYQMKELNEEVKSDGGKIIMRLSYAYPYIDNIKNTPEIAAINDLFETQAGDYVKDNAERYSEEAREMNAERYNYRIFEDIIYEFIVTSWVTCNKGGVYSVLQLYSEYLGGAHASNNYGAYVYDIKTGKIIPYEKFMGATREEALRKVKDVFIELIRKTPDDFFENSVDTVESLKADDLQYYIEDDKIIFFINPYEIAAFAYGPVMAELPVIK